ncbi:hypothetical protein DAA61_39170 [Bradyrhizobium sp. WBAH33]|nr:hypothetical protein DAA61_39170 [Bradyrhizobium sp. WBAH33]
MKHAVGLVDKSAENLARVCSNAAISALIEKSFCLGRPLLRWQKEEGQEIAGLIMGARLFKLSSALRVDQRGRDIRKCTRRIGPSEMTLRLNEYGPPGSEATDRVVQTAGDGDKFSGHCAIQVRSPELCRPLERAVLVQDDSFVDKGCPRQEVGEACTGMAIFGKVHHD